jgi:hypothetical protein
MGSGLKKSSQVPGSVPGCRFENVKGLKVERRRSNVKGLKRKTVEGLN